MERRLRGGWFGWSVLPWSETALELPESHFHVEQEALGGILVIPRVVGGVALPHLATAAVSVDACKEAAVVAGELRDVLEIRAAAVRGEEHNTGAVLFGMRLKHRELINELLYLVDGVERL